MQLVESQSFKLHDSLTNDECIGKMIIAFIDTNRDWITYSESNEGEKNYYRDYHDTKTGNCCYMDGEACKIESYNESENTVTLSNDSIDEIDFSTIFTISYEQYKADFGTSWMVEQ